MWKGSLKTTLVETCKFSYVNVSLLIVNTHKKMTCLLLGSTTIVAATVPFFPVLGRSLAPSTSSKTHHLPQSASLSFSLCIHQKKNHLACISFVSCVINIHGNHTNVMNGLVFSQNLFFFGTQFGLSIQFPSVCTCVMEGKKSIYLQLAAVAVAAVVAAAAAAAPSSSSWALQKNFWLRRREIPTTTTSRPLMTATGRSPSTCPPAPAPVAPSRTGATAGWTGLGISPSALTWKKKMSVLRLFGPEQNGDQRTQSM